MPSSSHSSPSNGLHLPVWRFNRLLPKDEQELELDLSDAELIGDVRESSSYQPSWEAPLVSKIRSMLVSEQSLVLETICTCLHECSQQLEGRHPRPDAGGSPEVKKLLEFLSLNSQQADKTFLFHLYGLILRECIDVEVVKQYLACLLELSHQPSGHREGIALAVGLASTKHLEDVWNLLEHLGRTKFLRSALQSADNQPLGPDLHWTWVSSTFLLCYGQMAAHAKERTLPWVDNLASRMVYYFSCSHYDDVLKSSFLSAAILLTRVLRQEPDTQNYKFTQIPELIQCLLSILQREPSDLVTLVRQKIILIIMGLSNLRPSLKPVVKSRVLQVCLSSVYSLPPLELLKSSQPPLESAPDVTVMYKKTMQALSLLLQTLVSENMSLDEVCFLLQHTEHWLRSDKSHERQRVVQSIFLLLQYAVCSFKFTEEATPSILGHQIGLLALLCRDKDQVIQSRSLCCIYLLLQLVVQQQGRIMEFMHWNKTKHFERRASRDLEMQLHHLVKVLDKYLTAAQHTQLVLTLLHSLCSRSHLRCNLASMFLLMIFEVPGIKTEQVAEVLQGMYQEQPGIHYNNIRHTMMKAMVALGTQHTQEVVEVALSLCCPSERQSLFLWKALATNHQLARKVMTLLYTKLKLRPPKELIQPTHQALLTSLQALGTIYELLYTQEYRATVHWAFAGILLGLLTQLHYLLELGMVEGMLDYEEDVLDTKPLGPFRTCLEALKGLFWTTQNWEVFAHVKLLQGWELLESLETYTEGVTLLARAMAHYDCEVKAVLGQATIFLKNTEERDNIVAIIIITEFLNSTDVFQHVPRKMIDNFLSLGLNNPNKLVRATSLKGLSSIFMHPKKVTLLQDQMTGLLDSFLQPEPKDLLGLMEILGDILHRLSVQGVGAVSLKIAEHLLPLFEDMRAEVRGGAIFLFGDVIHGGGKKFQQALKTFAFQALVPLLFHLADSCPEVVTKTKFTFLRCAIFLNWEFRKELFGKLAWGQGLGAENNIFIYMKCVWIPRTLQVESNYGKYHQFLMQALTYLNSPHKPLKLAAVKFIGGMLQDYFNELCFYLKKSDMKIFKKYFETLRQDPDSVCRRFYLSFFEDISELSHYVT